MTDRVGFLTAVFVRDQDRALDFYVDKLGFEKVRDEEIEGGTRWIEIALPGGKPTLVLIKPENRGQLKGRIGGHTGIVFETDNIQESYDMLTERGVRFEWEPTSRTWGFADAQFVDQDHNKLLLVQPGLIENFKKCWVMPDI